MPTAEPLGEGSKRSLSHYTYRAQWISICIIQVALAVKWLSTPVVPPRDFQSVSLAQFRPMDHRCRDRPP